MVQCQLKLILRPTQERMLRRWLWHLSGVFNWAVTKIGADAQDHRYWSRYGLEELISGHSRRVGIPAHVLRATVRTAHNAWDRCFQGLGRRPRRKGQRNRLNSIPFPDPIKRPSGNRVQLLGIGEVKFHAQDIPEGSIKCGRIVRRASGWYLCLVVEAEPRSVPVGVGEIGVDPGFSTLLTISSGEKVDHPHELLLTSARLAQSQRGLNRRLSARLHERQANQRKDRNHKLSRCLIGGNGLIAWSADKHRNIARTFGKSVTSAAHGQLRRMLAYKSRLGGCQFIEVPSKNSTRTCSACLALTGPTGWRGLSVRHWSCSACGAQHDRDVNAAVNTLRVGRGMRLESTPRGCVRNRRVSKTAKSIAQERVVEQATC